jgi:uncharacterized metal-binding protein
MQLLRLRLVLFLILFFVLNEYSYSQARYFASGYLISLFLFSPDLDTRSSSYRRWGPLRYFWDPYRLFFRHGGISHNPLIGPILRLIYLGIVLLALTSLLKLDLKWLELEAGLFFLIGFWIPSVIHYALDRKG